MRRSLRKLRADAQAATAVEYGLIAALVVLGMILGLTNLGAAVKSTWSDIDGKVAAAH